MSLTDSNKKKNYSNISNGNTRIAELPKSKMKDKIKIKKINTNTLVKDGNEGVGGIIKNKDYKNFKDYLNKKNN